MNDLILVEAINTGFRWCHISGEYTCWAELIFLYTDGTWEKIFEYRWPAGTEKHDRFNTTYCKGITREAAITKFEKAYYNEKKNIKGIFTYK